MGLGKIIASVFLSIPFILIIILLIIGTSIYQTALYPEVYQKALSEADAYGFLEKQISPQQQLIPVEEFSSGEKIKESINALLEGTLAYVRSDAEEVSFDLSISDEDIKGFFLEQAEQFETCSPGQQPFEGEEIKCRPVEVPPEIFLDQVLERKNFSLNNFSSVDLITVWDPKNNRENLRVGVTKFRQGLYMGLGIIIIFIGILVLIHKNKKSVMRWTGINFAIASIIILATSFLIKNLLFSRIHLEFEVLKDVLNMVVQEITTKFTFYGTIVLIAGLMLLGINFFIKKKD